MPLRQLLQLGGTEPGALCSVTQKGLSELSLLLSQQAFLMISHLYTLKFPRAVCILLIPVLLSINTMELSILAQCFISPHCGPLPLLSFSGVILHNGYPHPSSLNEDLLNALPPHTPSVSPHDCIPCCHVLTLYPFLGQSQCTVPISTVSE